MTTVTQDVTTASEYRTVEKAAKSLGLAISEVYAVGKWETNAGDKRMKTFSPGGAPVIGVGRTYFEVHYQDETIKGKPMDEFGVHIVMRMPDIE